MAGASPLESISEKEYLKVLEMPLKALEDMYLKNDDNKKKMKLMNALRNHVKVGGKVSYNIISKEYANSITESLENQNIPYAAVPDASGNTMFLVRDVDSQKFLEIQQSFALTSTDYAKELTPQNVLNLYKKHKIKNVDTLDFNSKEMAAVAEKKLYNAGVTFAKMEGEDGKTTLIISPFSKFSTGGDDLCNFELMHAFEQSKADDLFKDKGDLMGLRFKQATWDAEQMENFAKHVQNGENYVFAPAFGNVSSYIECNNLGVSLMERDNKIEGGWKKTPIDISKDASLREIEIALSKASANIRNAIPVQEKNFDRDHNPSKKDFTENDKNVENNLVRPEGEGKVKQLETAGNTNVKPMLEAINLEATKQINSLFSASYMTQQEAYEKKKEIIVQIMDRKELPEIQDFLNSNANGLSQKDREEWYGNIKDHFVNPNEKGNPYECALGKTSVKDMSAQIAKQLTKVFGVEPDKGKDNEPEYDDD